LNETQRTRGRSQNAHGDVELRAPRVAEADADAAELLDEERTCKAGASPMQSTLKAVSPSEIAATTTSTIATIRRMPRRPSVLSA
jgi:hypothetical protein